MISLLLALVVGTWNGNWFPSGRAEHRAHPDVEAATTQAAAQMLAEGIRAIDPSGKEDIVLCLNEIRGPRAASNLIARIGRPDLRLVSISAYRRRDRFDQQQDAIATTLPVAEVGKGVWANHGRETPPRGYAFAAVVLSPAVTAEVYAVHLKSNYGAKQASDKALVQAKRTHAIEELMARTRTARHIIVTGDMNADPWRREFEGEPLFGLFAISRFMNLLELLPPGARGTHPNRRYGDSALDHVFVRGFSAERPTIIPNDGLSDHYAVFARVR